MVTVNKIFEETIKTDHKVITEELSKSILKSYGVKVPPYALATSTEDAVKQAKKRYRKTMWWHGNKKDKKNKIKPKKNFKQFTAPCRLYPLNKTHSREK